VGDERLAKAGLVVHVATRESEKQGAVVACRLVRVDYGPPGDVQLFGPFLASLFEGGAIFEVEGQIDPWSAPPVPLHVLGRGHVTGDARAVGFAGINAGTQIAKHIIKVLQQP
jgi:hypothetical protein